MNKLLILITAAACLEVTTVQAAGPQTLLTPHEYDLAHAAVRSASSSHRSASATTPGIAAAGSEDPAFNAHVAMWRSFDVSAAVNGTLPAGINDRGEITGVYFDSNGYGHGFLRRPGGKILTFDAPNVGYGVQAGLSYLGLGTNPTSINNEGDIVGYYTDAAGAYHGFVRWANGNFTVFDDQSSTSSPAVTIAQAINDWGEIVGYWFDSSFNYHGFVRRARGSFITVDPPGDVVSQCYHINDRGEVGGDWSDAATGASHGMLLRPDGNLVTFDAPNAVAATFGGLGQALNFEGSFAGTYADANLGVHGYIRYANGKFAEFTAPGGGNSNFQGTWVASLNFRGTAVGYSIEPGGSPDGYVRFADGTLILADAPVAGQQATIAWAINDHNEFTGFWVDASGGAHGFVALAVP